MGYASMSGGDSQETMSGKQFKDFCCAIQSDPSLQQRLDGETDPSTIVRIAKEAGFSISVDEIKMGKVPLSEEVLTEVAAGRIVIGGSLGTEGGYDEDPFV